MDWDAALARMETIVSPIFDTMRFRLQPMAQPGVNVNAVPVEDSGRDGFEFAGTMDLGASKDEIARHLPADPGVRGQSVSYDGVITALTDGWAIRARKDDIVTVVAGNAQIPMASAWKIMASESDGTAREAFYVNRWKAS